MEEWIQKRRQLGLSVEDSDILPYIFLITEETTEQDSGGGRYYNIEDIESCNPFTMAVIVVKNVGWASWDSVKKNGGNITRDMLYPFGDGNILLFPWEIVNTVKNGGGGGDSTVVLLPWNRPFPEIRLDVNNDSNNRELELILRFIHNGEVGTMHYTNDNGDDDDDEGTVLKMVKQNKMLERVTYEDPTQQDLVAFINRYNIQLSDGPGVLPHVVLVVPWEECCCCSPLPIYGGLKVHITYREVGKWFSFLQKRLEEVTIPKRIYQSTNGNPLKFQDGQFKYLKPPPPPSFKPQQSFKSELLMTDIEDLFKALPPCLNGLIKRDQPLKDGERFHLARQLFSGRVSGELCKEVFVKLHKTEKLPWDPLYVYKKGYLGCGCNEFIENARGKIENTIHCPYASRSVSPQQSCTEDFGKQYPNKLRQGQIVDKPYQFLLWYQYRK
jgi:hypothetical protein